MFVLWYKNIGCDGIRISEFELTPLIHPQIELELAGMERRHLWW